MSKSDFNVSEFLYFVGVANASDVNKSIKCKVHKRVEKGWGNNNAEIGIIIIDKPSIITLGNKANWIIFSK